MSDRTYPHGVPCWVDCATPDLDASRAFYEELFGWTLTDAVPDEAPGSYLIATLDGADVAALAPGEGDGAASWLTYIAVDDADAAAARVTAEGGTVVSEPADAGPGGRGAVCEDPDGARFALWQARKRLGAQLVNAPGGWNFSNLAAPDPARAKQWYGTVFGMTALDLGPDAAMLQVPGYGAHLAATSDPGILERQKAVGAPPGFEDAVAGLGRSDGPAGWHVMFLVTDREAAVATAERLGATLLGTEDDEWTRTARIRDPQGAELTLSQFMGDWS